MISCSLKMSFGSFKFPFSTKYRWCCAATVPLPIILPLFDTSRGVFGDLCGWYADTILVRCCPEPTRIHAHLPNPVVSVPESITKLDRREKVATIVPPGTLRLWFSFMLKPAEILLPRIDEKMCSGPLFPCASEWAKFVPCSTMQAPSVWCLLWRLKIDEFPSFSLLLIEHTQTVNVFTP